MSQVDTIVNFALKYAGTKPSRYINNGMTYCQRFVQDAYAAAGLGGTAGSAAAARKKWMISNNGKSAPAGAAVYMNSKSYPQYGHVGVSVGGGMMVDVQSAKAGITKRAIPSSALGWGWNGGVKPSGAGSGGSGRGSVSASEENKQEIPDNPELKVYATNVSGRQTFNAVTENYHVYINGRDVTGYISNLEMSEDINSLAAELSFAVPINPKDKYMFNAVKKPACGDKISFRNGDKELFMGIIVEVGLDGTVKAYDYGWYMNKQEINYQCNGIDATSAIKGLCEKCGLVEVGQIYSIPTVIQQNFIGETPASILDKILAIATADQGRNYLFKVRSGKLNVWIYPTLLTVANYRQPYGKEWDITWLLGGLSGSQSIEDMKNKVVAVSQSEDSVTVIGAAEDKKSQEKYGTLQAVIKLDSGDPDAQAAAKLKELNMVTENYSVDEIMGNDNVISGVILDFSSGDYGVDGYYLVKSVKHSYGANHTMSLELLKVVKPS